MRSEFVKWKIALCCLFAWLVGGVRGQNADVCPVKPITGTWINLAYQDVRNKYTNPQYLDNTDPDLWRQKVKELADMGVEYLVFMAVANEGEAYYPSKLMPHVYAEGKESPVDAIMDMAAQLDMKVFMSTGWAKNQDDNLRDPAIKQRQLDMMEELASLYGGHKALYGWYLPVEDCLGPVLSEHAVEAVNALTSRARSLTPGKKIMISPYGLFCADFDNPDFEKRLSQLKVDIIAYQDEVGCVREEFPLVKLRENWKRLCEIHNRLPIEFWANCETFTWEGNTNDRTSALIPAAYPRLLAQQVAASAAGVDRIVSFMLCGIVENPSSVYQLGQPLWSGRVYGEYSEWKRGDRCWKLQEAALTGRLVNTATPDWVMGSADLKRLADGKMASESTQDSCWLKLGKGYHEIVLDMKQASMVNEVVLRMLNYQSRGIALPMKVYLFASQDGINYSLLGITDAPTFPNARHDAWIDVVRLGELCCKARYLKVAFATDSEVFMDEILVNPLID